MRRHWTACRARKEERRGRGEGLGRWLSVATSSGLEGIRSVELQVNVMN